MKYYEGNAPCPGCGRPGSEKARDSKDSLCYDCINMLEIGHAICKERDLARNWYKMDDLRLADMTWYTIPINEVAYALKNLLKTFSQFDEKYASYKGNYSEHLLAGRFEATTGRDTFVLPEVTFKAAQELCNSLKDACEQLNFDRNNYHSELNLELAKQKDEIYNEGVKCGRNLLLQLNSGEITIDEFSKRINKYSIDK